MLFCLSFCLFFACAAGAADRGLITVSPGGDGGDAGQREQDRKVALVIGNGTYENSPLKNALNDAKAMAAGLRDAGFDVTEKTDLDQKAMKQEIQAFGRNLLKGGVGLFYYAGHGVQVSGRNYLIPVGAKIEHERQVEYEAVDMGSVLGEMENARNRMNIVVLDACRDNPFGRGFRSEVKGLASVDAPSGTLIAYATAPGSTAADGEGENGPYTSALVKTLRTPGLKIEDVFKHVRATVRQETGGKQTPWESSSLEGDFYFVPPPPVADSARAAGKLPRGPSVPAGGGEGVSRSASKVWKEPATGMEFVWIPGGCFQMGSPDGEAGREADEGPVYQVCVDGFWMGKTEVTNGQFKKFQPNHDSRDYEGISLNGDSQPVVYVSWGDAVEFARWLKKQSGGQYEFRLPTEQEWEYAGRAGAQSARYWGDEPNRACGYENVADRSGKRRWSWNDAFECDDGYAATAPVAAFQPNGFGLCDMLGNVSEWCENVYVADAYGNSRTEGPASAGSGSGDKNIYRSIRGGHWHSSAAGVRCAVRSAGLPGGMNDNLGFRLIRKP